MFELILIKLRSQFIKPFNNLFRQKIILPKSEMVNVFTNSEANVIFFFISESKI